MFFDAPPPHDIVIYQGVLPDLRIFFSDSPDSDRPDIRQT